ncbi:hypothetical protein DSM19430T_30820 [Desulfovibrio psychrotolerans]|uniref:Uncharacterized protein n=1 Tax=Desulfovibrio psychrotolerans TaxID=415242 RepID=A0A7J0BXH5_9BACT|nr:hypothetical protein DSM19430T_30820 [Desulfovibrio psychrotolerans]
MISLPQTAERLCIYTGEKDSHKGRPLHECIVEMARANGLAGATVTRGIAGFGANSRVHTIKVLRLSEDLPLLVEIIDTPEKINAFLPLLDAIILEGLVTVEPVRVIFYRHNEGKKNA